MSAINAPRAPDVNGTGRFMQNNNTSNTAVGTPGTTITRTATAPTTSPPTSRRRTGHRSIRPPRTVPEIRCGRNDNVNVNADSSGEVVRSYTSTASVSIVMFRLTIEVTYAANTARNSPTARATR